MSSSTSAPESSNFSWTDGTRKAGIGKTGVRVPDRTVQSWVCAPVVVLRRDDDQRIGRVDGVEQALDGGRLLLAIQVLVVERELAGIRVIEGEAFGRRGLRGEPELAAERVPSQAACKGEDLRVCGHC